MVWIANKLEDSRRRSLEIICANTHTYTHIDLSVSPIQHVIPYDLLVIYVENKLEDSSMQGIVG